MTTTISYLDRWFDDADQRKTEAGSEKRTDHQLMVQAVLDVTDFNLDQFRIDKKTMARVGRVAGKLRKLDIDPDQVRAWFGPGGWWYKNDWRGKKNQRPSPEQVFEMINPAMNGNGKSEPKGFSAIRSYAEKNGLSNGRHS